jgi:hypothetical protein
MGCNPHWRHGHLARLQAAAKTSAAASRCPFKVSLSRPGRRPGFDTHLFRGANAVCLALSPFRSADNNCAPSRALRRAHAAPMPLAAPVMSA